MGRVTTADAATSEGVERVILVDRDAARAAEVAAAYAQRRGARAGRGPAGLRAALAGADAVVNAATHRLNVPVMEACLEVGAHYTDLGGLYYYAIEQYELDDAFRRAGLSAAISMGAAPGITNMLAAAAVAELDTVESIEVLDACVAGRPYDPDEPYVPAYAADTLIDEFTRPAPMFIDGREQLMASRRRSADLPPARGRRRVRLHDPLRAGHPPPLLRRPRHPQRRVAPRPAAVAHAAAARPRGERHGLDAIPCASTATT